MSSTIVRESPESAEPTRKMVSPVRYIARRPKRSDSRPHSGMVTVEVNRNPEKTQEYMCRPPRLPTTFGMAVATTVDSIAPRKIDSITPITARRVPVSAI